MRRSGSTLPRGDRIYVDPVPDREPVLPGERARAGALDLILLTHGHDDHVGDAVALARAFACPVVAQVELRGWLAGRARRAT